MDNQREYKDTSLLKSKEIDEIIGRPPHWLIQWGISVFFTILLLILLLSYFIKYPETVTAPFKLISNNPSVPVSIDESGSLIKLLIKDESMVHKTDILFYWKGINSTQQYAFRSPLNGRINFISPLFDGQRVENGQFLFYIAPPEGSYYAALYINSPAIQKIQAGQQVKLNLPDYTGTDDYFNGIVNHVSTTKTSKGYYIRVVLPNGLKSNKNKILHFKDDVSGSADIIINKRRLLDKFLSKGSK